MATYLGHRHLRTEREKSKPYDKQTRAYYKGYKYIIWKRADRNRQKHDDQCDWQDRRASFLDLFQNYSFSVFHFHPNKK